MIDNELKGSVAVILVAERDTKSQHLVPSLLLTLPAARPASSDRLTSASPAGYRS